MIRISLLDFELELKPFKTKGVSTLEAFSFYKHSLSHLVCMYWCLIYCKHLCCFWKEYQDIYSVIAPLGQLQISTRQKFGDDLLCLTCLCQLFSLLIIVHDRFKSWKRYYFDCIVRCIQNTNMTGKKYGKNSFYLNHCFLINS